MLDVDLLPCRVVVIVGARAEEGKRCNVPVFAKVPTPLFSVLVDAKNNHNMAVEEHLQRGTLMVLVALVHGFQYIRLA